MKQFVLMMIVCVLGIKSVAQEQVVQVATDQTSSIVFPFPIVHVDRGTEAVQVQLVRDASHILLVKAASRNIASTNLSVVTADGEVYVFKISYQDAPQQWVYQANQKDDMSPAGYGRQLLNHPPVMKGMRKKRWDMSVRVGGIYIRDKIMYYQLLLTNESMVDFDVDQLRFYIRDKKKGKRTASQELELAPIHMAGNATEVKGGSQNHVVVVLEKFTIPDAKNLVIELMEKNGGRHMVIKIQNRHIIKAIALPESL